MELDFLAGHRAAVKNAKDHLKAAEMLRDAKLCGFANSHLILASEEVLKAGMLFSKHFMPEIEVPDFESYFKDHKFKHKILEVFEVLFNFQDNLLDSTMKNFKNQLEENKELLNEELILEIRKANIDNVVNNVKAFPVSAKDTFSSGNWWKNANYQKNKGFYVNIEKNTWVIPDSITEADFNESYSIVSKIITRLSRMEIVFSDPEVQERIRVAREEGYFK